MSIELSLDYLTPSDLPFELPEHRNQATWKRYLEKHAQSEHQHRFGLWERAVKETKGYGVWKGYLNDRTKWINKQKHRWTAQECIKQWEETNTVFERALVDMHKMPRIWTEFLQFLTSQPMITQTRRTFDKALKALPVAQHTRVWELYLPFTKKAGCLETDIRVWKRYIKFKPEEQEPFIQHLITSRKYNEAAVALSGLVNNDSYLSPTGKSAYTLLMELCDLVCKRSVHIKSLEVEPIIRDGISKFTDQTGKLWAALARFHILQTKFEKARDTYEEAISKLHTVRDFTLVFDAYAEFEESMLSARMEAGAADDELDLRMRRFEKLMDKRPFLVNEVILRGNPHQCAEWANRVALYKDDKESIIKTYLRAFTKINPQKALGNLTDLWIAFAKFYEEHNELPNARGVFEKAISVPFTELDNLAEIWKAYSELELRQQNSNAALLLMERALAPPLKPHLVNVKNAAIPVQGRLFKSVNLWQYYLELEEGLGTISTVRNAYDRALELKVVTPQMVLNYALYVEGENYWEDSYKVYERGIDLFKYPIAFDLWNIYLNKFVSRYGGSKLERARQLFDQALIDCPKQHARTIYIAYAKLEEEHGLIRRALSIYEQSTNNVQPSDRMDMFTIYITKAAEFFGVTSTREIYESALEKLPDKDARVMGLQYADLERKIGEIDRARAIYGYTSQFCDPRTVPSFWQTWHEFEVKHGNEDTFKDMLRIKRSVQAKYNTEISYMAAQIANTTGNVSQELDPMAELESNTGVVGFVSSSDAVKRPVADGANPDEIEMDEMESSEDEEEGEGTAPQNQEATDDEPTEESSETVLGARERFKRKRGEI